MKITKTLVDVRLRNKKFVRFPFITMDSGKPGHRVVVVAGDHGNELTGVAAVRAIREQVNIVRGVLYLIPVANVEGFLRGRREVPVARGYERDLNRLFPGNSRGDRAERLAAALMKTITGCHPTIVIDLHNWVDPALVFSIIDRAIDPSARIAAEQSEAFARHFGIPLYRDVPLREYIGEGYDWSLTGALVNCAHIPAFTVELGGEPSPKRVSAGVAGVCAILKYCAMLGSARIPRISYFGEDELLRLEEVDYGGFKGRVQYKVKPGARVAPGTVLAICDGHKIRAKRAGLVIGIGPKACVTGAEDLVAMAVAERRSHA